MEPISCLGDRATPSTGVAAADRRGAARSAALAIPPYARASGVSLDPPSSSQQPLWVPTTGRGPQAGSLPQVEARRPGAPALDVGG